MQEKRKTLSIPESLHSYLRYLSKELGLNMTRLLYRAVQETFPPETFGGTLEPLIDGRGLPQFSSREERSAYHRDMVKGAEQLRELEKMSRYLQGESRGSNHTPNQG